MVAVVLLPQTPSTASLYFDAASALGLSALAFSVGFDTLASAFAFTSAALALTSAAFSATAAFASVAFYR